MRKILFLSLLFAATMLSAQSPVELPLWPDGAPNTNGLTGEQEELKGGRVANVTHPSITVYRPANGYGRIDYIGYAAAFQIFLIAGQPVCIRRSVGP